MFFIGIMMSGLNKFGVSSQFFKNLIFLTLGMLQIYNFTQMLISYAICFPSLWFLMVALPMKSSASCALQRLTDLPFLLDYSLAS